MSAVQVGPLVAFRSADRPVLVLVLALCGSALACAGCGAGAASRGQPGPGDLLDREFSFAIDGLRGPGGIL